MASLAANARLRPSLSAALPCRRCFCRWFTNFPRTVQACLTRIVPSCHALCPYLSITLISSTFPRTSQRPGSPGSLPVASGTRLRARCAVLCDQVPVQATYYVHALDGSTDCRCIRVSPARSLWIPDSEPPNPSVHRFPRSYISDLFQVNPMRLSFQLLAGTSAYRHLAAPAAPAGLHFRFQPYPLLPGIFDL